MLDVLGVLWVIDRLGQAAPLLLDSRHWTVLAGGPSSLFSIDGEAVALLPLLGLRALPRDRCMA